MSCPEGTVPIRRVTLEDLTRFELPQHMAAGHRGQPFYGGAEPHLFTYWTADNDNTTGCYNLTCGAFVQTSVTNGPQYTVELAYWLTGGRWWLYYNGTSGSNAIGYYPVSIYQGGALATQGWQKAAYQRTIGYWPPAGGAMINASLTPVASWPSCYTAEVVLYAAPWYETL